MGTRGLYVYRRRAKFFTTYNHHDSYPDSLGVAMVNTIPRDPSAYKTWLEKMRTKYDRLGDQKAGNSGDHDDDNIEIRKARPLTDLFIEYVYEIDLDDEVFWLNGVPMFRLDCMPTPAMFLEVLGNDHYGHYATKKDMPEKHAYQIATPTQTPSEEDLSSYDSFFKRPSTSSPVTTDVYELLGVSEHPSPAERVRVRLYEVIIGVLMSSLEFVSPLLASQVTRTTPSTSQPYIVKAVKELVVRAFLPMVFHPKVELSVESRVGELESESEGGGPFWLTPDVCFRAGFHLDYDDHLHASVGKMVHDIHKTSKVKGIVYGVLCSLFHCVIVKVNLDPNGSSQHTSALKFLPSRFAKSPSTPGITALLRLASRHDAMLCKTVLSSSPFKSEPQVDASTYLDRLPPELIARIESFIPGLISLLTFTTLNDTTKAQASQQLNFPFVGHHHLLGIPVAEDQRSYCSDSGDDNDDEDDDSDDGLFVGIEKNRGLNSGTFFAMNPNGRPKALLVSGLRLDHQPWGGRQPGGYCFGIFTHDSSHATFVLQTKEVKL